MKQSVLEQLQARINDNPDVKIEDDKITIIPAKSSITLPNGLDADIIVKIVNNHIANLNNRKFKIKLLK